MQLATTHLMSCKLFEKWWNGELAKHNKLTWISSPMAYATVGEFIAAAVALPSFQAVASSVTERTWCYTVACLLNLLSVQAWAIQLNCTCLTITSILALIKSDCLHLSMNEWWFLCSERMATSNGQASVLFSSDNLGSKRKLLENRTRCNNADRLPLDETGSKHGANRLVRRDIQAECAGTCARSCFSIRQEESWRYWLWQCWGQGLM